MRRKWLLPGILTAAAVLVALTSSAYLANDATTTSTGSNMIG